MENKRPQHKWTKEEIEYLKEITPGHHHKEILDLMNEKFEYEFGLKQVTGAIKRYGLTTGRTGYFKKGSDPWNKGTKGLTGPNKTSFKKGRMPQNHKPIGSERIDNKEGYIKIKIGEPDKWELKHKFIYEKYYGEVKEDEVIMFLDGNKTNFNIENLYKVSRHQLLLLNKNKLIYENAELTKLGIEVTSLIIRTIVATKRAKNE